MPQVKLTSQYTSYQGQQKKNLTSQIHKQKISAIISNKSLR